ncbi:LppA family lipoprotein [Mycobacteroides abscessus]|uniref:LppA family lipoprotein n=1 Tax=Mycobacteroides abscessus TaxID=36809 RepID=UPI0009283919|nr:LppA family lipoprotein [Mycobacteroides abscessus]SIK62693.1 lipoprotein LppV [Mycobacteroides abscessus subsp. abscessus]
MTRNMLNRKAIGCIAAIIFLTMTGCHVSNPYEPTPPDESAKALEELKALPSLEDTKTQLQNTIESIKASIETLIPKTTWSDYGDKGEKAGCSNLKPFDQSDGQSVYLPSAVASGVSVSEGNWASILQATKEAAAKLGATNLQVFQDNPSKHDVGLYGPAGLFIKVRYAGNLVVSGYTGCRLPAAKK